MDIDNKDRVSKKVIKVYEDINGFDVIKELLLHRGESVCRNLRVSKVMLVNMALVMYGLKVNTTNKLCVDYYLFRFYKLNDMITDNGYVKVPQDIYNEVVEINNQYRKKKKNTIVENKPFELYGIAKIKEERESQINDHGFDVAHDRKHNSKGQLRIIVASILQSDFYLFRSTGWHLHFYGKLKNKPEVEKLAICGALIAAEIDRITDAEILSREQNKCSE